MSAFIGAKASIEAVGNHFKMIAAFRKRCMESFPGGYLIPFQDGRWSEQRFIMLRHGKNTVIPLAVWNLVDPKYRDLVPLHRRPPEARRSQASRSGSKGS